MSIRVLGNTISIKSTRMMITFIYISPLASGGGYRQLGVHALVLPGVDPFVIWGERGGRGRRPEHTLHQSGTQSIKGVNTHVGATLV